MNRKEEIDSYLQKLGKFLKNKFCSPFQIEGKEVSRNIYAKKSGISQGTLSRLSEGQGYDVPISTIYRLCSFENVSLKDFFTEFEGTL